MVKVKLKINSVGGYFFSYDYLQLYFKCNDLPALQNSILVLHQDIFLYGTIATYIQNTKKTMASRQRKEVQIKTHKHRTIIV